MNVDDGSTGSRNAQGEIIITEVADAVRQNQN